MITFFACVLLLHCHWDLMVLRQHAFAYKNAAENALVWTNPSPASLDVRVRVCHLNIENRISVFRPFGFGWTFLMFCFDEVSFIFFVRGPLRHRIAGETQHLSHFWGRKRVAELKNLPNAKLAYLLLTQKMTYLTYIEILTYKRSRSPRGYAFSRRHSTTLDPYLNRTRESLINGTLFCHQSV